MQNALQGTARYRVSRAVSAVGLWLGLLALPAVLCLLFPGPLSTGSLREHYPMPFLRGLIQGGIFVAFGLGVVSFTLKGQRVRGLMAIALAVTAQLLGGGYAEALNDTFDAPVIGLDFLLLDLFALCVLFVPLERLLGKRQKVLREGWNVDLAHFASAHAMIGVIAALSVAPAHYLFGWVLDYPYRAWIASLHPAVQLAMVVVVVDLTSYWVHRAFHFVPFLWRFHAVHHSVREMDWLAGSRQHLGDVILTRALGFVPVYVLGFSQVPIYLYILLISFYAVFIHANARVEFGWLDRFIVSPKFHHWHHAAAPEAVDRNFSVMLPIWDDLFGTAMRRTDWPARYGLVSNDVPQHWGGQFVYPLMGNRATPNTDPATPTNKGKADGLP